MVQIIGLTGGIATGKSLVSSHLDRLGYVLTDADEITHNLLEEPTIIEQIIALFGPAVATPITDQEQIIDRQILSELIFTSPQAKKQLESLLHPLIIAEIKKQLSAYQKGGAQQPIFIVAPLLIETDLQQLTDQVWLVEVSAENQLKRLMKRNNISKEQAQQRIGAQLSPAARRPHATHLIDNNGSPTQTTAQVDRLLRQFTSSN